MHLPSRSMNTRSPLACWCVACCLTLTLFAAGCAHDTVPLTYNPTQPETIPAATAPKVCVVLLADARNKVAVGQQSDGSTFIPASSVQDWLTRALATELARQDFVITVANSETEAQNSGAKYIITGSIAEVWLVEESSTSYACTMRASMQLKDNKSSILTNNFSSSLSRRVVPLASAPQDVLADTASDLVRPMALAIRQKLIR